MMKRVDVLQFDDCPNVEPTVELIRRVATRLGVEIDLHLVRIESAEEAVRTRFLGSPTVRVDDIDIDPAAAARSDFGLSCRVYGSAGVPSEAMIAAALTGQYSPRRGSALATGGSIIAAALSSACCWLPLLLAAVGISAGRFAQAIAPFRPWFVALAVLSLAIGVWMNERQWHRADCGCEPSAGRRRMLNRVMLAISTVGMLAFLFFPKYVGTVFGERDAYISAGSNEITLQVDGMTCSGCETGIEAAVRRVPGIALVDASYDKSELVVLASPGVEIRVGDLVRAVAQAGYTAYAKGAKPERENAPGPSAAVRVLDDNIEPVLEAFNSAQPPFRFLAILSPT